jgi:hypothetical protein
VNGHSTPNGQSKSSRKKARHPQSTSVSVSASASTVTGSNGGGLSYAELQEQRKQLSI